MKKLLTAFLVLIFVGIGFSQVSTLWEKSAATSSLPSWFSASGSTERGLGYGLVSGNHRLYVVSRNGGSFIYIYNALTGDSVGTLSTAGMSGGTFALNDIGVSNDGLIFVCNLTANASTGPFKVYKYTTELDSPVVVINYTATAAARIGDKFTVTGSASDNSLTIWAASANTMELYKFTTTDNGVTFTPTVLPLTGLTGSGFGTAAVGPYENGKFYWNANGWNPKKYNTDGTVVGTIPGTVVSTGSNAIRYISNIIGDEYVATFAFGAGNENARIVKVPGGDPSLATLVGTTSVLGTNGNANGTGDVEVRKVSKYIYQVFVLGTNNGFGAYQVDLTPTLSGDYYIGAPGTGPGGSNPNFATLGEAFDVIYDATIAGDCNFYITSDITEPNIGSGIGLAKDPGSFTLTFKPYTGVQPVITLNYPADANSGPSGALIIGIPTRGNIAWDSMKTTRNIIIDGSNTIGGTTRDLTIQTSLTAHRNSMPMVIVGDVANIIIKNTNIYYRPQTVSTAGNLFIGAVMVRSRNYLGQDWVPHDIIFENNHLSGNFDGVAQNAQGYGVYQTGTPLPLNYPYNIILNGNLIEGKRRGVALYRAGSHTISNNEIKLNQNIAANTTNEAIYAVDVDTGSVVNIYNNKISQISSITNAANNGNTAISIESFGTYNVYNNFIYGFELTATNPTAYLYGIKNSSANATLNCYFNSIHMNDISASGTITYNGLLISNGINDVRNNIVVSNEQDFVSYCVNRPGTNGTLTSDYNDFYASNSTNGFVGFWNTAAAQSLNDWQTASGQDANSISADPLFVSGTDLHLSSLATPVLGKGIAISGITTDFDGETRDSIPEIGADEYPGIIPVELVSFAANVADGKVKLSWATASEKNNSGFEIQRSTNSDFKTIGFVEGKGTTTERNSYSFVDDNPGFGAVKYRLKQIDFNGIYSYSNIIEVDVSSPVEFDLAQNYPNPFNPTTTIRYTIAKAANVSLVVYNVLGEEILTLVNNQFTEPGVYNVVFDATNLASGTYIYRLTADDFVMTKKMILTK